MPDLLDIGEVIERSGLPASTLHFYERRGLIHAVARQGLRRQYEPDVLDRLAVIVMCRRAGFTLEETDRLLVTGEEPEWRDLVAAKLEHVQRTIATLQEVERGLAHTMECPSPNLFRCEHFRAELARVLPADN